MKTSISRRKLLLKGTLAGMGLAVGFRPGQSLWAQDVITTLPEPAETLARNYMKEFAVPGLQLTYRRGSRELYNGCFGEADHAEHRSVKPDSLFRIASNSKAFTSAAIFLLVEAGRLQLTDRVFAPDGLLPQFAELGEHQDWLHAITVHQLLTHTGGGWGNERNDPMFEKPGFNHEELIRWALETHPLQHPPGEKYAYSNFGYCVLGRVIERVSKKSYAEFVQQHVLRPARIHDMRIGTNQSAANEVRYYGQDNQRPYDIPIFRMDAHGGWIASAADMANFMAGLFSPSDDEGAPPILKPESLKTMIAGTQANPNYACGLAINKAGNAWHTGSLPGTMSLMVHTHGKMVWAVVLNTRSTKSDAALNLDQLLWQIARSVPSWQV